MRPRTVLALAAMVCATLLGLAGIVAWDSVQPCASRQTLTIEYGADADISFRNAPACTDVVWRRVP